LVLNALRPAAGTEIDDTDKFVGDLNAAAIADQVATADATMP
jgi:hypothetical protein